MRRNTCGFSGDRWRIDLSDGTVLRLRLYWPRREAVCAVRSVHWEPDEGWRVVTSTPDGRQLLLRAFHAELHPVRPERRHALRAQP